MPESAQPSPSRIAVSDIRKSSELAARFPNYHHSGAANGDPLRIGRIPICFFVLSVIFS